jgi:two-component system sensor histidine kinase/response regulator
VARAPFDPRALVRETNDALLGRAEEKGLALVHDVDPAVPATLIGDALKIQQVLANLAGNAVKFTQTGGVIVALRLRDGHAQTATIDFSVTDTGIGIPEDRLEAIFEEFTQADSNISKTYGGTGLGLTISRRLVELLGGRLSVESELGKGSTFRFALSFDLPKR